MTASMTREAQYIHGADIAEQERLEQMAEILGGTDFLPPLETGMRILEVGCGTGAVAREVARKVAPSGVVIGVDQQEIQLQTARRLASDSRVENLSFLQGEASDLGLPDAEFDGVYCRFLVEHVPAPVDAIREMARVVKPGGWVCCFEWENGCSVNYPEAPVVRSVWQAVYDLQASMGGDPWIARKLKEVLSQAGLGRVEAIGHAWSITADDREKLHVYVQGAREIIGQARGRLLSEGRVSEDLLVQADGEYERLLGHPAAFVMEGYVCATGFKAGSVSPPQPDVQF